MKPQNAQLKPKGRKRKEEKMEANTSTMNKKQLQIKKVTNSYKI